MFRFAGWLLPLSLLLLAGCSGEPESTSEATAAPPADTRPNILLIVVDDLGFSDIEPFGGEISTPNLSALAMEGTRFTNFHTAVKCNPTRAMLNTGIDSNLAATGARTDYQINPDALTSAELLRDAGYHTYISGKWDNGSDPGEEPFYRGFERTYVMLPGAGPHYKSPMELDVTGNGYRADGQPMELPDDFYSSVDYTDKMIEFIESNRADGKPFFAFASYTAPHYPMQAPAEFIDKYLGRYDGGYQAIRDERIARIRRLGLLPEGFEPAPVPTLADWNALTAEEQQYESKRMAVYAGMIDLLDREIGRLIGYLSESGELDNTLVFFMSDNGADGTESGAGAADWHDNSYDNLGTATSYRTLGSNWAHVASTPLNWYKTFTAEGGVRTPAIAWFPGRIEAGAIRNDWFQVMDLAPTFLELAGISHPGDQYQGRTVIPIQGRSLLPLFERGEPVYGDDDYRFHSYTIEGRLGGAYVQQGNWKLAWWKENREYIEPRLFDVAADPAETVDLAAEYPDRVADLKRAFVDYAERNNVNLEQTLPESW